MKYFTISLFTSIILTQFSCQRSVVGDVRIYGTITDAWDNTPVTDVSLRLYKDGKKSSSEVLPTITMDSLTGFYDVRYITTERAKWGYYFVWSPNVWNKYYFSGNENSATKSIHGNDCPYDIVLQRIGYLKVRLIDVPPFDYLPYPEFHCDGNVQPVDLYNYDGDTTFTVRLVPNADNYYELISRHNNFIDTVIAGVIRMNLSGDTLYQTLQY